MKKRYIYIGVVFSLLLMVLSVGYYKPTSMSSDVIKGDVVATVNGESITKADVAFYQLINRMQLAMNREADRQRLGGKELEQALKMWDAQEEAVKDNNTLLTQIIRLRAIALLAKEKGYTAAESEVEKELANVKQIYAGKPVAMEMIKHYGEERFWQKEHSQFQLIVLSKKVQQDMIDKVKKENPKAAEKEVHLLAQKKYEELLISQIGTLKISLEKQQAQK